MEDKLICENCNQELEPQNVVKIYDKDEVLCLECAENLEARAENDAEAYNNENLENQATGV